MESDVGTYKKMSESLTAASKLVGTAREAAEQMVTILKDVQAKVVEAKKPGADLVEQREELLELFLIVLCVVHVYISFSIG